MLTILQTLLLGFGFAGLGVFGALVAFNAGIRRRVLRMFSQPEIEVALLGDAEMRRGYREGMLLAVALLLMLIFLPVGLLTLVSAVAQAIRLAGG